MCTKFKSMSTDICIFFKYKFVDIHIFLYYKKKNETAAVALPAAVLP